MHENFIRISVFIILSNYFNWDKHCLETFPHLHYYTLVTEMFELSVATIIGNFKMKKADDILKFF